MAAFISTIVAKTFSYLPTTGTVTLPHLTFLITDRTLPIAAASNHIRSVASGMPLPPLVAGLADMLGDPERLATPHVPARATTSYSEARKLKSSLFLRDNFAPLPAAFRSIPDALHHILPNNRNMEFRTDIQAALETVLGAHYCNIITTLITRYALTFRADEYVPAVAENDAEADKMLNINIQCIETILEYQRL